MAHADAVIPVGQALRGSAARRRREATVRAVLLRRGVVIDRGQRLHRLHGRVRGREVPDERRPVQPGRDRLVPAPRDVRHLDAAARHPDGHGDRDVARDPDRPRERDLPRRIRHAPGPPHRQADHRDPGRRPEHRPGVLRTDLHQPEDRPEHLSRGPGLHDPGGGHRGGDPVDPARRHRRRGRHAGRAPVAPGSVVRPRRATPDDQRPGRRPGRHLRDRRRAHPGREPRDRRDDGRRPGGRCHRRRRAELRPSRLPARR